LDVKAAVDPRAAYLTTWAMRRVVTEGTAKWLGGRLPKDMSMAGKTGTTDDKRDSWFAGFSGDKVAVVWVGRDDYKPMGLAGGQGALPVWAEFMLDLPNEPLVSDPPEGVVLAGCGTRGIPYAASGSSVSCGGGEDGGESKGPAEARPAGPESADPAEALAQAAPKPREAPEPAPKPAPKPERKQENFFLDL
jgi:penicillin-binding protein 1B